jgi:tRNA (guanine37-N1)-methyltransferase
MKKLEKMAFSMVTSVLALKTPLQLIQKALDVLSTTDLLLDIPRIKKVVEDPHSAAKLILFKEKVKNVQDLSEEVKRLMDEHRLTLCQHPLQLTYEHFSADQVLRAILPDHVTIPTAFETIGHIAHLNLREEHEAYKSLIGEIVLDKHRPQIRTVVNKTHSIETVYRCFPMELLAGDMDLVATVKENSCIFKLDFGKVYWNSRLYSEHERLVSLFFKKNEIIVDMFAGVGPFAIPAAKLKGAQVYANDLNPHSYTYLCENAKLNKIHHGRLKAYNLDARIFVNNLVKEENVRHIDHIVMNLPSTSLEFLDIIERLRENLLEPLPLIHCHHFIKDSKGKTLDEHRSISLQQIRQRIPEISDASCVCYHHIRDVSPSKEMYCISFRLPLTISEEQRCKKRMKQLDDD